MKFEEEPAVIILLTVFLLVPGAFAQISPGKLAQGHSQSEGIFNCMRCHELGREVTDDKCLACHTVLNERILAGRGFHSSDTVAARHCAHCHSDHNGLEFKMIHWPDGIESFDHTLAGYALEGAHARQRCKTCHRRELIAEATVLDSFGVERLGRTFLGLEQGCVYCHFDEHAGQLPKDCLNCHSFDAWKPAGKFDHARSDYPLTGRHADIACNKCHKAEFYAADIPPDKLEPSKVHAEYTIYKRIKNDRCQACHDDPHEARLGNDCTKCHTTAGFRIVDQSKFDHSRTRYALEGKHTTVNCMGCHKQAYHYDPGDFDECRDCHDDAHRGQFAARQDGGACDACHTIKGFSPANYTLADHRESDYPLTGSHLASPCNKCHVKEASASSGMDGGAVELVIKFRFEDKSCLGCHRDPHQGQLNTWIVRNGCEYCHSTSSWHKTTFDHGQARFSLEGKHLDVLCRECHEVRNSGTPEEVIWMKPLPIECHACHEDPHRSQFASVDQGVTDCSRCHESASWRDLAFNHNRDSRYRLDGAHSRVPCQSCHKPEFTQDGDKFIRYKPLGTACADCHESDVIELEPGKG